MDRSLLNIASRINAVRVEVVDLLAATREVHKLPPEKRDFEGRAIAMVRLFPNEPEKAQAVESRIQAMGKLLQSGALPHWATPEQSDGSTMVAESVWRAAATEPLLLTKFEAYFDRDRFVERVLDLAEPNGRA